MTQATTVTLRVSNTTITVPVEVNGLTATFILDSGAERSVVTQDAVLRLGIARDQWVGTTMGGVGGIDRRPNADPRTLTLGGVPLVRQTLSRDTSLTVALLPHTRVGDLLIDGLLGRDFLAPFDLDLDMPNRRLTLYRVQDCSNRFLPWSGPYTAIPVTMPAQHAILVPVQVDGTPLRALLDTGTTASLIAAPGMVRLRLDQAALMRDPAEQISGLGPSVVTMHRHVFGSMQVADQKFTSPSLWVEPIRLPLFADMILAADWLMNRHVWISFSTAQLFLKSD